MSTAQATASAHAVPSRADPLNILEFSEDTLPETIGWFRHAEIKHGRVAMAAFVGYCVQSSGFHFPWALTRSGVTYEQISAAGSPADQWDALPFEAKLQIIGAVGFLEVISENSEILEANGQKHYVRGGKPGYYPPFKGFMNKNLVGVPHPLPLNLYDPFGTASRMTPEQKAKGLLTEINNGRLAMIGIMAFLSESKVPGAVPALSGLIKPYAGEYMAPFTADATSAIY
jgi:hypothetical protein